MKNITLYANGDCNNHGCEAIYRATEEMLEGFSFTFYSLNKKEDLKFKMDKLAQLKAIKEKKSNPLIVAFLRLIRKVFKDENPLFKYIYSDFYKNDFRNKIAFCVGGDNYCYSYISWLNFLTKTAKNKGATVVLWGCSIEVDSLEKSEVLKGIMAYDKIFARESLTYNALIENGYPKENLYLYPDPAFSLKKIYADIPKGFIVGKTIGINASPLIMKYENDKGIIFDNYSTLIKYIERHTDYQIAFISHVKSDDNVNLQLMKMLEDEKRCFLIDSSYNCMEIKGYIARLEMFIGARTHATIAAYSACVPTIVAGYSIKSKGIAKDIFGDYENYVCQVQDLKNDNELTNSFIYLNENADKIRKYLNEFMPMYIEKCISAKSEVAKIAEEQKGWEKIK